MGFRERYLQETDDAMDLINNSPMGNIKDTIETPDNAPMNTSEKVSTDAKVDKEPNANQASSNLLTDRFNQNSDTPKTINDTAKEATALGGFMKRSGMA
jgi:hypothetical protein